MGTTREARGPGPAWAEVATGIRFPEGPSMGPDGRVYLADSQDGRIYRVLPEEGRLQVAVGALKTPAATAWGSDGKLYVTDAGAGAILRVDLRHQGRPEKWADGCGGKPFKRPNDLVFDESGYLYFTDSGRDEEQNVGGVFRVSPGGVVSVAVEGLEYANGIALTPDGRELVVAETTRRRVVAVRVKPQGVLGPVRVYAELEGSLGPDGMAFDQEGQLYVAHYGAGTLDVFSTSGTLVERLAAPGQQPTNVAFGGTGRRQLYLTEVETHALWAMSRDVPGARPYYGF